MDGTNGILSVQGGGIGEEGEAFMTRCCTQEELKGSQRMERAEQEGGKE